MDYSDIPDYPDREWEEDDYGMPYKVWKNVPDEYKITPSDEKKKIHVWVANIKYKTDSDWNISDVHEKGEDRWPYGGYTLRRRKGNSWERKNVLKEEVIKNPQILEERIKKQKKKERKKINKAKKKKYYNPFTEREVSYSHAKNIGIIDRFGNKIPKEDVRIYNPETGRYVSYNYAKQKGLFEDYRLSEILG